MIAFEIDANQKAQGECMQLRINIAMLPLPLTVRDLKIAFLKEWQQSPKFQTMESE